MAYLKGKIKGRVVLGW